MRRKNRRDAVPVSSPLAQPDSMKSPSMSIHIVPKLRQQGGAA